MRTQRPTGVSILAIWYFLAGVATVVSAIGILFAPLPTIPGLQTLTTYQIIGGLVWLIIGVLQFATGWGLWELRKWAHTMATVFAALGLLGDLIAGIMLLVGVDIAGFRLSAPGPAVGCLILALINGLIIYYLQFHPEVTEAFGEKFYSPAPVLEPTELAMAPPERAPAPPPPAPPRIEPTRPLVRGQPAMAWLVVTRGPWQGRQFGLNRGRNTVGRDATRCDIALDDEAVSGEHARINFERGQFVIYDLASTNGTFVNNRRIQRQALIDNDVILTGNTTLVFKQVKAR